MPYGKYKPGLFLEAPSGVILKINEQSRLETKKLE